MNSHIDIAGRKLSDLPRVFMQPVWAELIKRLVEDMEEDNDTPGVDGNPKNERALIGADISAALAVLARRNSSNDPKGRFLDLSRAHLSGVSLADVEPRFLGDVRLKYAHLEGVSLAEVDLGGANLEETHLEGASLARANLVGAILKLAHLKKANLVAANLAGADLLRADLQGANLTGADMRGANLTGADLAGAVLAGANLTGATFDRANLRGADMRGANLTDAGLAGAALAGAALTEATFDKAYLKVSTFSMPACCLILIYLGTQWIAGTRAEPIVCTPEDAFYCFMGTGIETLALGNCFLRKENQDPSLIRDYKDRFELD